MPSKTESVRRKVFRAILAGEYRPGDKIPTERDMATMTRTSRVTVRRAYAELEARGILIRRQGSGAYISTALQGNPEQADTVAVLASLNNYFALEFINALERAATDQDAFLLVRQTDESADKEAQAAMALVEQGRGNLVVWASGAQYDEHLFGRLRVLGANIVFFDRMVPGPFADFVGTDNKHAVESLMERARARGRKRFLFVSYESTDWSSYALREATFQRACQRDGFDGRIARIPWGDEAAHLLSERPRNVRRILMDDVGMPVLQQRMADWFHGVRDLAVICVNDYIAMQVKLVKPRLDVYGIDGLPEAVAQGITSYRHPMADMARIAIRMLVQQQKQGEAWKARRRHVRGELVQPR